MILLSCAGIPIWASIERPVVPPAIISYPQNSTVSAHAQIYIEHSSVSDLVVDLGVGDPSQPRWSVNVWNRKSSIGNLNLTVDISAAAQYLPPSEENKWFLRVFDARGGNQGQIDKFTIISGSQTFDSTSIPVAIYDFQASYSYIPGVPLELAISRRISIRDFPATENYTFPEVSSDLLSKVLWAGYGASSLGRTTANISGNYPLVIYVCNKTAVYKYNQTTKTRVVSNMVTTGFLTLTRIIRGQGPILHRLNCSFALTPTSLMTFTWLQWKQGPSYRTCILKQISGPGNSMRWRSQ